MYLVSFRSEGTKMMGSIYEYKKISGFHFLDGTLIIRYTKVYYW